MPAWYRFITSSMNIAFPLSFDGFTDGNSFLEKVVEENG